MNRRWRVKKYWKKAWTVSWSYTTSPPYYVTVVELPTWREAYHYACRCAQKEAER